MAPAPRAAERAERRRVQLPTAPADSKGRRPGGRKLNGDREGVTADDTAGGPCATSSGASCLRCVQLPLPVLIGRAGDSAHGARSRKAAAEFPKELNGWQPRRVLSAHSGEQLSNWNKGQYFMLRSVRRSNFLRTLIITINT